MDLVDLAALVVDNLILAIGHQATRQAFHQAFQQITQQPFQQAIQQATRQLFTQNQPFMLGEYF